MALAYAGDPDIEKFLEDGHQGLPTPGTGNNLRAWGTLFRRIEVLACLGRRHEAGELYPLAVEATETGLVIDFFTTLQPQLPAGIAAAAGERWTAAEEHFCKAIGQAADVPYKLAQPEVRRWYAQMLLDRGGTGDRDKARTLLGEATEMYRIIGMQKHLKMTETMLVEV